MGQSCATTETLQDAVRLEQRFIGQDRNKQILADSWGGTHAVLQLRTAPRPEFHRHVPKCVHSVIGGAICAKESI